MENNASPPGNSSQEFQFNKCEFGNDFSDCKVKNDPLDVKIKTDLNHCLENIEISSTAKMYCEHCESFYKCNFHNIKKCLKIQETVRKYDGDFLKLLQYDILCCSRCKKCFGNYKNLYEHHIKEQHCIIENPCKICQFTMFMNSKLNLLKSRINVLNDEEIITNNNKLQQPFRISDNIINVKGELPFKCSFCKKLFRRKSQAKTHMRIHTNNRPYKCKICLAAFTISTNLKNHIIYKHTKDRPYFCEYEGCEAKFKLFNLKKQHERIHLPANFQCEICGNDFKTNFLLLKHQQSKHEDATNWPYQCGICHKRFARQHHLVEHERTHTGEKPFGCDMCSKFFRKRSSLFEHKRLHSEVRKYICQICSKGFKQAAGYWSHMKRHPVKK